MANDKDSGKVKKAAQLAKKLSVTNTFEAIALEWYNAKVSGWSKRYADYVKRAFKNNVFPYPGSKPVNKNNKNPKIIYSA
ncbi:phage integrase central domain-containing protein [Raoultella terrigena]|uniref:phage integrase central domain-containing protein n=1 Tax=Raoultella terrigena TaxID=577 RepID=UPI003F8D1F75